MVAQLLLVPEIRVQIPSGKVWSNSSQYLCEAICKTKPMINITIDCKSMWLSVAFVHGDKMPWLHLFSFKYCIDTDVQKTEVGFLPLEKLITLLSWFTESLRLMVPDSSNRMTSLAGLGFKTEEDHLNIKIVTALLFIMPAHYLIIWTYVSQKQKKLKIHSVGTTTLKNHLMVPLQKLEKLRKSGSVLI